MAPDYFYFPVWDWRCTGFTRVIFSRFQLDNLTDRQYQYINDFYSLPEAARVEGNPEYLHLIEDYIYDVYQVVMDADTQIKPNPEA